MKTINAAITGVYGYVPSEKLTNAALERMVDTSDEWITTRTGMKERRILKQPHQGTSFLAIKAAKGLLQKTNTDPAAIDLLICATITPDYPCVATANIISDAIQAKNAFSYDLQAACSGFLYALVTAEQFIKAGKCKKVIVVGADKMSSIVNYTDRTTCILFGDGAGAVLLESNQQGYGIQDSLLLSDGSGAEKLYQKAGGSKYPATHETVSANEHFIQQDGRAVFKEAVTKMSEVSATIMRRNHLSKDEIAFLVAHQANKRIIDVVAKNMGLPPEKIMLTLDKFGNTTGATLPLCLWQYENQLKKGDNLILSVFGSGYTWGSVYLKWAYNVNV